MNPNHPNPDEKKKIEFENGKQALLTTIDITANPLNVLEKLGVEPPQSVIVLAGGANTVGKDQMRRLEPLFTLGIARAAQNRKAVIIDGGTKSGVMELMGKGVSDQNYHIDLVGVVPSGGVTIPDSSMNDVVQGLANLDPNHTGFVVVKGENWGDETAMMYDLAETLHLGKLEKVGSDPGKAKIIPTITILVSARINSIALKEALATVRKGWPLVVIDGSGPLTDEIARRYRSHRSQSKIRQRLNQLGLTLRKWVNTDLQAASAFIDEIVENGEIVLFSMKQKPSDLEELLVKQLKERPRDSILLRAWKRFAVYDINAARHQKTYRLLKTWPLVLGVLATALILLHEFLVNNKMIQNGDFWYQILRVFIILVPIVVSLFLAADRLFKSGNKWRLLRYYAEEIKKDIYSFRVLTNLRHRQETDLPDEASELSENMTQIGKRLMRTEANESALKPYTGPIPPVMYGAAAKDDGLSPLASEDYINIRINDQLNFYSLRANQLEKKLQPLQWLILIFGAIGSLLAALGGAFQFWVPLTVAFVSALTAYLEYQQVEQTIVKYNQAMTKLENLSDEWVALSAEEKKAPKTIVRVIKEVESVMQSEHLGWVQQMQTAQSSSERAEPHIVMNESETVPESKGVEKLPVEQQESTTS